MERVKEANKILKIYPKLKLGEKIIKNGKAGGVASTGPHTIKIIAEPTTTMVRKGDKTIKGFKFIVDEGSKLFKWLVPMTDAETGEGHYLMEHLEAIEVGELFTVEMKKEQGRNFIEVKRSNGKVSTPVASDDIEEVHGEPDDGSDDAGFSGEDVIEG